MAAQPYEGRANGWLFYPAMASAGLWTTPSDLCRFAIEIEKALVGQSKVLSKALAQEMLSYQSEEVYGLGMALGQRGHALRFWHSGSNDGGWQSQFEAYPQTGQGWAVMTDGSDRERFGLIGEIQRAVAEEYRWPDGRVETHTLAAVDSTALREYTGVFLFGGLFRFRLTLDNGELYLQYPPFGDKPQRLFAESETRFFLTSRPFEIEFEREPDGSVKKANLRNGPEQLAGEKISGLPRQ